MIPLMEKEKNHPNGQKTCSVHGNTECDVLRDRSVFLLLFVAPLQRNNFCKFGNVFDKRKPWEHVIEVKISKLQMWHVTKQQISPKKCVQNLDL